jgi:hypothetical protein
MALACFMPDFAARREQRMAKGGEKVPYPPLPIRLPRGHWGCLKSLGEMVVQDGGAHLRGSGAEDLLQWTDAEWEKQRAARSKN